MSLLWYQTIDRQRISQLLAEHQSDTFAENISENLKDIKNIPSKLNEYLYSLIKLEKAMYFLRKNVMYYTNLILFSENIVI